MADIASGLFALGGFALAEAGRWLFAGRARREALEDREHTEERDDTQRWRDDRRQAHAAFLSAATALEQALEAVQMAVSGSWCYRPPEEPHASLETLSTALDPALAELELIGGDDSNAAAREWVASLESAMFLSLIVRGGEEPDEDNVQSFTAELHASRGARGAYVAAARAEIGTTRRTSAT